MFVFSVFFVVYLMLSENLKIKWVVGIFDM